MTDAWDDMKRTKEEEFFQKQNKELLSHLKANKGTQPRLCPADGQALSQLTVMNVQIDQCPKCHGVWLDAGELETLLNKSAEKASVESANAISEFLKAIKRP